MDHPTPFEYSGGALCLDFANTWGGRHDPAQDRLGTYDDLVRWAAGAGLLETGDARRLCAAAAAAPERAAAVLAEALALREAVFRVLSASARRDEVVAADVEILNRALERALPRLRLLPEGSCCRWEWSSPGDALDPMLGPVARSAAELLTGPDLARVGECASPTCAWLFLDRSRNRRRRWCDMASCGNRAKARRHYARRRGERGG